MAESNEPPAVAAAREVLEELGVRVRIGRVLVLDWEAPHGPWDDQLVFVHDGCVLGPDLLVARTGNSMLAAYRRFDGTVVQVGEASRQDLLGGLARFVEAEGPVLGSRLHTAYVRASGAVRVTKLVAGDLNKAISQAVRKASSSRTTRLARAVSSRARTGCPTNQRCTCASWDRGPSTRCRRPSW